MLTSAILHISVVFHWRTIDKQIPLHTIVLGRHSTFLKIVEFAPDVNRKSRQTFNR